MDFGIAVGRSGSTQTAAGSVVGTLEYMAPEQARARRSTAAPTYTRSG